MIEKKVILLDLGGVFFHFDRIPNEKMNWKVISKLNEKYEDTLNRGEYKLSDYVEEYNNITEQYLSSYEFLKYAFDTSEINMELIDALTCDREIVIVSDACQEVYDYITGRYNLRSWSTQQIYSFQYKMIKSNPIFFNTLLSALSEYSKENMVFIDDHPRKIASAKTHNIKTILFENNEQTLKELKDYDSTC